MPADPAAQTTAERVRSRKPADPAPETGYTAKLVRGAVYHLSAKPDAWPDKIFRAGETVQISQQVFEHLAERATDLVTMREGGQVTAQLVRKFRLSAPDGILPKVHSEVVTTVGGGEEVADPYA